MRRSRPLLVLAIVLLATAALPGPLASGRVAGVPVQRLVPHAAADRATPAHAPLRFTLVDAAGATLYRRPHGPQIGIFPARTPLGFHSWAWARRVSADHRWALVGLTTRPNGGTAWIRLRGHARLHTAWWVHADLSRRRVLLLRGRHVVARFAAAVGAPGTPTPTGRFFVTDLVPTGDPSGPFGWFAFGLSGHQPNLPAGWTGGDQLAIHGTNDPASIGTAASAGCLRVSATALGVLRRHLRLGTPVVIGR